MSRPGTLLRSSAVLISVIVLGCSGTSVPTGSPGSSVPPTAGTNSPPPSGPTATPDTGVRELQLPSRAGLIGQAVAEGRLDEVTALEYRAKAMFGLPGLPDDFAAGVPREDSAALAEMAAIMDDLSEADQARLRPYLLRPTEAGSPFSASTLQVASLHGVQVGPQVQVAQASSACRTWKDSGDLDHRFKVWACADQDAAAAEIDIAVIVTMVQGIWDRMSNDMGGPPKPDAHGPNVPAEYGGDARIDFYALHMGQILYRDGPNQIPTDAAAATSPAPPFTEPDGRPRNASSAFMLMNIDTLETDEQAFRQDLVHEFFHALQLAHNYRATHQGTTEHWFVESTATWAETYYLRDTSYEPHKWFFAFQESGLGLDDFNLDHQYASYVFPFFMEQEKGAQTIFNAWKQTDRIASRDFKAVTITVSEQVPFPEEFRDFAVRNLNLNDVLPPANEKRYEDLDTNFYDDVPPLSMAGARVSPGSPYVSPELSIPTLGVRYFEPEFSDDALKVTISLAQLNPAGQFAGDFVAHLTTEEWKRIPIENGVLQFCRTDPGWNIDRGFLVVSNHGIDAPVTGHIEIDAKEQCQGDVRLHGTFTGHTEDVLATSDATFDLIIIWHRPVDVHDQLNFEFESGNFTFSTSVIGVCSGSLSDGGRLDFRGNDTQVLTFGDGLAAENVRYANAQLLDRRLDTGELDVALTARFDVPHGSEECQPPFQPYGYIPICPLKFAVTVEGTFEANATCEDDVGTTWTGHLVEQ